MVCTIGVVAADYNSTCQSQVKSAFVDLLTLAQNSQFDKIQSLLNLCDAPTTTSEVCVKQLDPFASEATTIVQHCALTSTFVLCATEGSERDCIASVGFQ